MTETENSNILKGERLAGAKNKSFKKKRKRNTILVQRVEKKRLDKKNENLKKKLTNTIGIFHAVIKGVIY
jgi:hypothetical protein